MNPPKCTQGKVTFRTSERRRYPERGPASLHSHWSVLNVRLHLLSPLYTWCTLRSADHATGSRDAHTETRYARDSKRNDGCGMSARRNAGKNDVRESIRVTRPIIARELDVREGSRSTSISTCDLIEGPRVC